MQLTSLNDVNAWLGLEAGHQDEALLTRLITSASGFVERWCHRRFALEAYTEQRDGNNQMRMTPLNWPIRSVISVQICNQVIPAAASPLQGNGWFLVRNIIHLRGYAFQRGGANIILTYTAGWLTPPDDIAQAVIELVSLRYKEKGRIGLNSVSAAGETTSYSTRDMPADVATLLNQYRRVVPVV
jgi:hypothetical protein